MQLESMEDLIEFALQNLNFVLLVLVVLLLFANLFLECLLVLFKVISLVVEFVFESEEMLVKRNSVPKKSFISTSFVLLVDFSVFEQLDFVLHQDDLLLHIEDILLLEILDNLVFVLPLGLLLLHFMRPFEVRVALEFLVSDARLPIVLSCITGCPVTAVAGLLADSTV